VRRWYVCLQNVLLVRTLYASIRDDEGCGSLSRRREMYKMCFSPTTAEARGTGTKKNCVTHEQ
jgi:hypothetical protein